MTRFKRAARVARYRIAVERWMNYLVPLLGHAELKMLTQDHDDRCPLPPGAGTDLDPRHPRLQALRQAYARLDLPVCRHSQWADRKVQSSLQLQYFRGENPYVWQYREWPRAVYLKYYIYAQYVRSRDQAGLMQRLQEDGAFGCWSFDYAGIGSVSRDLLDSINEILFLERQIGLLQAPEIRVLDIGAGYGRLAHRMSEAVPGLRDYCCVDAVPDSTFLSEYYLRHRNLPHARTVPLHEVPSALPRTPFDLAVNVHSFSECTHEAIAWWMDQLKLLRVPLLFIVPNDRDQLLSSEPDGRKRDFAPLVEAAGYRLRVAEQVIADPAVRDLMRVHDYFMLYERVPEAQPA